MIVKTEIKDKYSFTNVSKETSQIVVAHITADLNKGKDSLTEYLPWMVLSEALRAGCGNLSREHFLDKLNQLGSSISISMSKRFVNVDFRATAESFDKTLSLFRLMLSEPAFKAAELKRIKSTLKNELNDAREDSKMFAEVGLRNSLWQKEDRRHAPSIDSLISGLDSVNKKMLENSLSDFKNAFWQITFGGKGDLAKKFLKTSISLQNKILVPATTNQFAVKSPKRIVFHEIASRQNIDFAIGSRLPLSIHDEDFPALSMGISILGKWGGFAGRLMSTVREKEGLTYSIYAKTELFTQNETGQWRIFTFFSPEKAEQGVTSTLREINNIYKQGVTEAELNSFKKILKTGELLSHDSLAGYTGKIHAYHTLGFSNNDILKLLEKQEKLTVSEVNSAIKKYLDPKNLTFSAAGPVKNVKDKLIKCVS